MSADFTDDQTRSRVWSPPPPSGAPRLLALWEGGSDACEVGERPITVGRAPGCQLVIGHSSVSREHARFHPGSPPSVEDLGSSNGTYLGGRALAVGVRAAIAPGELVMLGSAMLVLQTDESITSEPTAVAPGTPLATSEAMTALYAMAERIAKSDISVLVLGETGVGKEVMARFIHERSLRAQHAMVRINCAALHETLLESELFGHEKGAFTGAAGPKPGLLEAAHGGTVFLDEVGEMPLTTQAKLLRALETREVLRVGSVKPRAIDVRFVSATNRRLDDAILSGSFRRDLYFRLAGMTLEIPPLRERPQEILELARRFLEQAARAQGRPMMKLSWGAEQKLTSHTWPGNARELKNVIERALILCGGAALEPEHLVIDAVSMALVAPPRAAVAPAPVAPPPSSPVEQDPSGTTDLRALLGDEERRRIIAALEQTDGNQTRAAALLGISRRMLINRLEAYQLPRPRKK